MKHIVANIYADLPKQGPDELFQTLLAKENIKIERIISRGHACRTDEWYDQQQDEWVMLIKGQAKLQYKSNATIILLNPGDYIYIPAHTKHRVHWTAPEMETIWLAIHIFPNENTHD